MAIDGIKIKEGQIDQSNIIHKDASNELKTGAFGAKVLCVQNGNLTGEGLSLLAGYTTGKPIVGMFFGLTSTFGNHGNVIGNAATYLTMAEVDRGWIFQSFGGGVTTNVASIDGLGNAKFNGTIQIANATASNHAVALGQLTSNMKDTNQSITANYTIPSTAFDIKNEITIFADATAGNIIVTLTTPVISSGNTINIIKTDSSVNSVTVKGSGTTLVNDANTFNMGNRNQNVTLKSNGTQHFIF